MSAASPRPRPVVADLPAYRPGRSAADAITAHGIATAIKLASNEATFGPLPSVAAAMAAAAEGVNRYPAHGAPAVRAALADHFAVGVDQVAVSNGSVTLLQQLCLAYVDPGDAVVYGWPSFEAYPIFVQLAAGRAVAVPNAGHGLDAGAIAAAIDDTTRLVFVANPNNPTGTALDAAELTAIADAAPVGCLVVVDEAYREFVTDDTKVDAWTLLGGRPNVAVLRTFSKAHGLAGLRVGYLLGDPAVVDAVDRLLIPFAVNAVADAAAQASLGELDAVVERCRGVAAMRDRLVDDVRARGWECPDSHANFIWLPLGAESVAVGERLERGGVVTRVFADVGIRVTIGTAAENDQFLAAIGTRDHTAPGPTPAS